MSWTMVISHSPVQVRVKFDTIFNQCMALFANPFPSKNVRSIGGMILPCEQRYIMRGAAVAISFKGAHFPKEAILIGVRWYVAYPLSTRHVEELMEERGVEVDHSTINRWVIKYSPQLEEAFPRRKRPVWVSWRMDETYIKVKGQWRYLYRAVDKHGHTIDLT